MNKINTKIFEALPIMERSSLINIYSDIRAQLGAEAANNYINKELSKKISIARRVKWNIINSQVMK